MVKILVCLKLVSDLEMVLAQDWLAPRPDISYANRVLNCFDESALELALRCADGGQAEVTVLSVGLEECDKLLKNALAVKATHAARVHYAGQPQLNAQDTAHIIAGAARHLGGFDLYLFGKMAGEYDNGQTGPLVAEMLGLPCVCNVMELAAGVDAFTFTRQLDGGQEEVCLPGPLVAVVGNTSRVFLRMPGMRESLRAKKVQIPVLTPQETSICGADAPSCFCIGKTHARQSIRAGIRTHAADGHQLASRLADILEKG